MNLHIHSFINLFPLGTEGRQFVLSDSLCYQHISVKPTRHTMSENVIHPVLLPCFPIFLKRKSENLQLNTPSLCCNSYAKSQQFIRAMNCLIVPPLQ